MSAFISVMADVKHERDVLDSMLQSTPSGVMGTCYWLNRAVVSLGHVAFMCDDGDRGMDCDDQLARLCATIILWLEERRNNAYNGPMAGES